MRPFEGVKIIDCTHVLAGPFATYQLAVLGADVIKIDDANEPDQQRESGADMSLNKARMGTGFLTQGSNKRSIAINLKTEAGREALKRLVRDWADVFVENYRPGAFEALGLGYKDLSRLKPKLVYASMSAFGQQGPRREQTAYDMVISATSGLTAATGTETSGPIKVGAPVIDYATGTTGAFAISAALYQTLRTGQGQYIDLAMFDVGLVLQSSHVTDNLYSGHRAKRAGNKMRFAAQCAFDTKDGLVQLAASNGRQHRRFYSALGDEEEAKRSSFEERALRFDEKYRYLEARMKEKTADEWESFMQSRHVPAARVRELAEALKDPHVPHRGVLHKHENVPGLPKPLTVPVAAFKFAHDGPSVERPPARLGEHTDEILRSIGYAAGEIAELRKTGAVS
jgi:crotonobetainyl-CoA:carnitine CoA-transferase CaiB-like acyl-CoA transferase